MAYLKLVMNHTTWGGSANLAVDTYRRNVLNEIQLFLTGSRTTTAQMDSTVINTASSVIINGASDRPSTNIYRNISGNNTSNAAYSLQYITFKKYHYGNQETGSTDANFGSYNYITIKWMNTYGFQH